MKSTETGSRAGSSESRTSNGHQTWNEAKEQGVVAGVAARWVSLTVVAWGLSLAAGCSGCPGRELLMHHPGTWGKPFSQKP